MIFTLREKNHSSRNKLRQNKNNEHLLTQGMFGGAGEVTVNGAQTLLYRIVTFLQMNKYIINNRNNLMKRNNTTIREIIAREEG